MCLTASSPALDHNAMPIDLYTASVPVFTRYLGRLAGLLDAAESHASSHGIEPATLLAARLAPDMLPLSTQVEIAANFALRACFPLAGLTVPPYGEFPATLGGLRARIAHVVELIGGLQPAQFDGGNARVIESQAGDALVALPADEFLL